MTPAQAHIILMHLTKIHIRILRTERAFGFGFGFGFGYDQFRPKLSVSVMRGFGRSLMTRLREK